MPKPTAPAAGKAALPPALSPEVKEKIKKWQDVKNWLAQAKDDEMKLRRELAAHFVPKPKEGTNHAQGAGFEVVLVHEVTRKLDVAALDSVLAQLPERYRSTGEGGIIRYKPDLATKVYRAMSPEERKTFDQALTITDGAPKLEIVLAE